MTGGSTLTRNLIGWALAALALVWGTFIVAGFLTGEREADEVTDGHLASVAALLMAADGGEFLAGRPIGPAPHPDLRAHDYQQTINVVVWDAAGQVLTRTGDAPLPAFTPGDGFATLQLGEPDARWRVFARWNARQDRKLMVLLSMEERDGLAKDMAEQMTAPGLWLLPVIALVLGLAIYRGLRPLHELSHRVHALDIQHAQALAAPTGHRELQAVVDAINLLIERYQAALLRERALASEFAHELRTPLASLALQARALREAQGEEARDLQACLERDALRAGEVLAHLLALARASRAELDEGAQDVDLLALARSVVGEFAPAAAAGGRDLGLVGEAPFHVQGHAVLLELALRNLVENALSHTPAGTQVEVRLDAAARRLEVCDHLGEAAPPGEGGMGTGAGGSLGLGLGHRVVEKIAAVHGARFEDVPGPGGTGRCYRIAFGVAAQE